MTASYLDVGDVDGGNAAGCLRSGLVCHARLAKPSAFRIASQEFANPLLKIANWRTSLRPDHHRPDSVG